MPLVRALETRVARNPLRLCVPGHGGGVYAPEALARAVARAGIWRLDWTEVAGLDDLAWPHGPIRAAEEALAGAFGADQAAILVGGSTAGILAAVLAFAAGGAVAMAPSQHRSVYAALALGRARPVFLPEDVDQASGLVLGLRADEAARAIAESRPDVVLVVHPTYHGVAPPLAPVVDAAHAIGALVVADSAHGAHFGLDPRLPTPALAAGVDIAVLGLHKSLGALTQTALIAWQNRADGERLRAVLRLIHTSSPSYLLMASADAARDALVRSGRTRWRHALDRAERLRERIGDELWRPAAAQDPSRVVWLSPFGRGQVLLSHLREVGVEPEHADERSVLLLAGPNLAAHDMPRLERALGRARARLGAGGLASALPPAPPARPVVPDRADGMFAALAAAWEAVPLTAASGRIAADFLVPYPPGVPIAVPGARLDGAAIDRVAGALAAGREVQGVRQGATIRVVRTERGPSP